MPTIDISGTSVAFPFKPYDCQLTYIKGVLTALDGAVSLVGYSGVQVFGIPSLGSSVARL